MSSSVFTETTTGVEHKDSSIHIVFGNKNLMADQLTHHYPTYQVRRIKQTHSDICVPADVKLVEADAHWSNKKNECLVISTADCTPIMIHCLQTNRVLSIHAGWKGVANQITFKSLKQMIVTGSSEKKFRFWVGPRILQKSFVVQDDVLPQLLNSTAETNKTQFYEQKNDGYYVDLQMIIRSQIEFDLKINPADWFSLNIDTKTDMRFWSHRRDQKEAGRNLSFITLI